LFYVVFTPSREIKFGLGKFNLFYIDGIGLDLGGVSRCFEGKKTSV